MRSIELRRLFWSSVLALGLVTVGVASPALAQDAADPGAMQTTDTRDDDGTDWGWIGLLGLAGLLGLRKRDHVERVDRVDTTRTRP